MGSEARRVAVRCVFAIGVVCWANWSFWMFFLFFLQLIESRRFLFLTVFGSISRRTGRGLL